MHIAAESPEYLSADEIPERVLQHEKEIARAQIKDKPANMMDKIIEGKLKAYFDQVCLLKQKFIKDPSLTIEALVANRAKEIGKTTQSLLFSPLESWRVMYRRVLLKFPEKHSWVTPNLEWLMKPFIRLQKKFMSYTKKGSKSASS